MIAMSILIKVSILGVYILEAFGMLMGSLEFFFILWLCLSFCLVTLMQLLSYMPWMNIYLMIFSLDSKCGFNMQ